MKKEITRRDFINGVSIAAASAAVMDPRTLLAEAMENISPGAGGGDECAVR